MYLQSWIWWHGLRQHEILPNSQWKQNALGFLFLLSSPFWTTIATRQQGTTSFSWTMSGLHPHWHHWEALALFMTEQVPGCTLAQRLCHERQQSAFHSQEASYCTGWSLSSIGQDSRFCLVDSYTFWNAKWVSTTSSKQPCSHIWLVASFILYCYTQPFSLAQHVPSILSIGDYKVHLWTLSRVLSRPKGILSIQHCLKVSSTSEWCLIKQLMGSTFLLRLKMIGSMLFLFPSWLQPTCLSNRHCDTYRCRLLYKWYASLLSMTKHKIICIADEHGVMSRYRIRQQIRFV